MITIDLFFDLSYNLIKSENEINQTKQKDEKSNIKISPQILQTIQLRQQIVKPTEQNVHFLIFIKK